MQVTHENILSHLYKFEKLKTELIKLRKNFNDTTVSDIKNKASSIDLSRWEDIISAKVETKVDDLKTNVIPSIGSSISKDFEEMVGMSVYIVSNTEAYAADKETYENIKKEISSLESSISNQSTETEEGRQRLSSLNEQLATEREKLDKAWAELEKDLNNVNFLLNAIANIRFVLSNGSGNNGNNGNGNDEKFDCFDMMEDIKSIPEDEYNQVGETEVTEDPENPGDYNVKEEYEVDADTEAGGHYTGDMSVETTARDIDGDGQITENDALIYQKVHEEGTYTAPDGTQYGYIGNTESDEIGIVHVDETLTDSETGEDVYHREQDREAAYTDITGSETQETNTTIVTEDQTIESREIDITAGDNQITERVDIVTDNADPECGVVQDGETTETVYRDENGNLRAKREYVDKNGNVQVQSDVPIENDSKTFTIKYPDGHTESMNVNPNNPIDQQRMMNKLEDARSQYYTSSSSRSGLNYNDLVCDGRTTISDAWSDSGYEFTLE